MNIAQIFVICAAIFAKQAWSVIDGDMDRCRANVLFVFDRSGSTARGFAEAKEFVLKLGRMLSIHQKLHRVAWVAYAGRQSKIRVMGWNVIFDQETFGIEWGKVSHTGGTTDTAAGLIKALEVMQSDDRPRDRKNVVVVITDGQSQTDPKHAADQLREKIERITVYAVSPYNFDEKRLTRMSELLDIAGGNKSLVAAVMKPHDKPIRKAWSQLRPSLECFDGKAVVKALAMTPPPPVDSSTDDDQQTAGDDDGQGGDDEHSGDDEQGGDEVAENKVEPLPSVAAVGKPEVPQDERCRANVLLVIDRSSSTQSAYTAMKNFVRQLGEKLNFGEERHRIAWLLYSGKLKKIKVVDWDVILDKPTFIELWGKVRKTGGQTYTAEALERAFTVMESEHRPRDRFNYVCVITDGYSFSNPSKAAEKLRGIEDTLVYAIAPYEYGVIPVNEDELIAIAGTKDRVAMARSAEEKPVDAAWNMLSEHLLCNLPELSPFTPPPIKVKGIGRTAPPKKVPPVVADEGVNEPSPESETTTTTTEKPTTTTTSTTMISLKPTARAQPLDEKCTANILLIIDKSTSTLQGFNTIKDFIEQLGQRLKIGLHRQRVAWVLYAGRWKKHQILNWDKVLSNKEFSAEWAKVRSSGGTTYTREALVTALKVLNSEMRPPNRKNIAMVVTDGYSYTNPKSAAEELQNYKDTLVFAVAPYKFGIKVRRSELIDIAGSEDRVASVIHEDDEPVDIAWKILAPYIECKFENDNTTS